MRRSRPLLLIGLLLLGGALALEASLFADVRQSIRRTVHVTVTGRDGAPVTDLSAAEFEVKYGGKTQEVASVKLATLPLRVALVVADRGTGMFQAGALRFIEGLLGYGEFSIIGVVVQPERYVDYSSNVDALRGGLLQLQRRGTANQFGGQLVEAILETTKEVRREGYRSVILVLHAGGTGGTPIRAQTVRDEIQKSGAILYGISRTGTQSVGGGSNPTQAPSARAMAYGNANSEIMEGELTLGTILGDGSKESGGRYLHVVSTSLIPTMQQIAAELLNQYEVTYVQQAPGRPSDRLSVSVTRRGLTVTAPSRLPS